MRQPVLRLAPKRIPLKFTLTFMLFILTSVGALAAANASSEVRIAHTGFGRNRATGIWSATMTVTNRSAATISGPVQVMLAGLPADVALVNSTGVHNGSPYITVSAGPLAPRGSVRLSIRFTNPSNGFIHFRPSVYSGDLP